jgi:hypothetical protein
MAEGQTKGLGALLIRRSWVRAPTASFVFSRVLSTFCRSAPVRFFEGHGKSHGKLSRGFAAAPVGTPS